MFIYTTAIKKIRKLDKFVRGIQGGTSAGKTFGIIPVLIDIAIKNPLSEISIVSESLPHLRRGAMKDFKSIMMNTNRWFPSHWHETNSKYTFSNGSFIEFFGADDSSKLRGARRSYLYINECNNVTFHAYTELASRTKEAVYLDWNPVNEFWFHHELQNDNDVDFITINYLDNEACPESALNFILKAKDKSEISEYWKNWYKVYGLGEIGNLQGVVFDKWTMIDILPSHAKLVGYGMDFGYTNDPTTLTAIYKADGFFIFDEVIYQKGLTNSDISNLMNSKGVSKNVNIYADSAEPKSIRELSNFGWRVKAAEKGSDSVMYGINKIQEVEFKVTKQSTNLVKELRSYIWDTDREGKQLNKPIDAFNHCIDGIRYYFTTKDKFTGKYQIVK